MHISTTAQDLTGIKHAIELGLILAAIVLAIAAHGSTKHLKPLSSPADISTQRDTAGNVTWTATL